MIKVCHITSVHNRYDTRIFLKECTSLIRAGYDVTLLVGDGKADEAKNGVKIVSVSKVFTSRSRINRVLTSSKVMFAEALKLNADIYHLHDPELLPLAKKLKNIGKKVVFDNHEDISGQILGKKWIPKVIRPIVSLFYTWYSNVILKQLDYIIGVTPHLTEKLKLLNKNVELITNYPILNLDLNNKNTTKSVKNSFCFAGGITDQWNHETILRALENIDATYVLMGKTETSYIEKLMEHKAWEKVIYHGVVSHEDVTKTLSSCTAGLAILSYSDNTYGKVGTLGNTKLFEFMENGLPVICTDFILWKEIVKNWKCGICIPPGEIDPLQKAMQYMIDNPDKAKEMGDNGRRAVLEEFNWGIEERKLLKLYKQLSDI